MEDPTYASLITKDGQAIPIGSTWKRPEYAATLRKIAKEGAIAFYQGEIAKGLVKAVRDRDGVMTVDDLKSENSPFKISLTRMRECKGTADSVIDYKVKWREPLSTKFKNYTLYAPPAPASGAIWLSVMGMLSQFELAGYGSVTDLHRLTEALRVRFPSCWVRLF